MDWFLLRNILKEILLAGILRWKNIIHIGKTRFENVNKIYVNIEIEMIYDLVLILLNIV